jgi:hypothetical protein
MQGSRFIRLALVVTLFFVAGIAAHAADVGRVKVSSGAVYIERAAQRLPAAVGTPVQPLDTIVTGADGAVGITFIDNSRIAAGPNSMLSVSRFDFNQATHAGAFDATLKRGTFSVVSGKIAKQSPQAMRVMTPTMVLGVRGTEFVVHAGE